MQALRFHNLKCLQQSWDKWREVRELIDEEELEPFLCLDCLHLYS